MFNIFQAAETLTGVDDPAGITIIHPTEPTQDCDECNSSHPASDLIPFPWKECFKSVLGDRDVEYDIQFSVCGECNERLRGVRMLDITAHVEDRDAGDETEGLLLAA